MKPAKAKKCRHCSAEFQPRAGTQVACSVGCAIKLARARADVKSEKEQRAKLRRMKESVKTLSDHAKEAQAEFNRYIRARDKDLPCISCGRFHDGQYHAGHYRTVGANPELRFEPLNVNKQCAPCNNHKSGDIVNYRINLIQRIGEAGVKWLEGPHPAKKYTREELQAIKAEYRAKWKELQNDNDD